MVSDIWKRTIQIGRKETRLRHIGYSFRLAERVLLYASFHRQDNTYHGLCYISHGALAGTTRCMKGGIIMLKNQDVGVVMEQGNDVMSENVIAVLLNI